MDLVRILHPDEYEPKKNRFRSSAFEPFVELGDISVFEEDCAVAASLSLCRHAEKFYPSQTTPAPRPFYLWRFSDSLLPLGSVLKQKQSESGDNCHYNISGLTKKSAKKWFKTTHVPTPDSFQGVWKCDGSGLMPVVGPQFM